MDFIYSPADVNWLAITMSSNFIVFLLEFWLDTRQIAALKERGHTIPEPLRGLVNPNFFKKNSDLNLRRLQFSRLENTVGFLLESIVLYSYVLVYLYVITNTILENHFACGPEQKVIRGIVFILVVSLFSTAIKFPFEVYRVLFVEVDLSRPINKLDVFLRFIEDQFKSFVASILFGIPMIGATLFLFNAKFPFQWLSILIFLILKEILSFTSFVTSIFIIFLTFYFSDIYVDYIAPFMDNITPLNDKDKHENELKILIWQLAVKLEFPLEGIYKMQSPHSKAHSNAILLGFGSRKKIVIYENLIDKLSTSEVLAIVGHEMGHSKFSHVWVKLLIQAFFVGNFITFFFYVIRHHAFYDSFGFNVPDTAVGFVLFSYFYGSLMSFASFLTNFVSRRFEYSADKFALETDLQMESALVKMHAMTAANIMPDKIYSVYHYSHPSLMERLQRIEEYNKKKK